MAVGKEVDGQLALAWIGCGGGEGRLHIGTFILETELAIEMGLLILELYQLERLYLEALIDCGGCDIHMGKIGTKLGNPYCTTTKYTDPYIIGSNLQYGGRGTNGGGCSVTYKGSAVIALSIRIFLEKCPSSPT